jgi:hypothetical protein
VHLDWFEDFAAEVEGFIARCKRGEQGKVRSATDNAAADRLYSKALSILHEGRVGLWLPKIRALALRGHTDAMVELADWLSSDNSAAAFGRPIEAFGAAGLYYRAYRQGCARAAYNAAMSRFNRNDMAGYRRWLGRAAKAGDTDCAIELGRFETRLPHGDARKVHRLRPWQKRDAFV